MSLPPLQAALGALIIAVGNAFVALELIGSDRATRLETGIVGIVAAAFLIANAIHAHGEQ